MSSTNKMPITLERILGKGNIGKAIRRVLSNKGAPGVDGMKTCEFIDYCQSHPYEISNSVLNGTYEPQPIKRVYIPKDNGEMRPLGIPTVIDRVVQQAVAQVLQEEYEKEFSESSFGFRPELSCKDAVVEAFKVINQGKIWIIDLDLSKFFDTVNHSKLLQLLSDRIDDGRVISLIHKFLKAPVMENGKVGPKSTIGTPQGGCISPVLANIMLNELDQLLDSRGISFCRYADDMVIMCGSEKAAKRILKNVTEFLEGTLFLKVNKEKTKIGMASPDMQFLGFGFTDSSDPREWPSDRPDEWNPVIHEKKVTKLKDSLRKILDRRAPGGIDKVIKNLKTKLRGWVNYFCGSIPDNLCKSIDGWIRRRIRQLYWKNWKTPQQRATKFKELCPYAPDIGHYPYANNNYWHMARTKVIHTVLRNSTLQKLGWVWIARFDYQSAF